MYRINGMHEAKLNAVYSGKGGGRGRGERGGGREGGGGEGREREGERGEWGPVVLSIFSKTVMFGRDDEETGFLGRHLGQSQDN